MLSLEPICFLPQRVLLFPKILKRGALLGNPRGGGQSPGKGELAVVPGKADWARRCRLPSWVGRTQGPADWDGEVEGTEHLGLSLACIVQ